MNLANEIKYNNIFNALNRIKENGKLDEDNYKRLIVHYAEILGVLPYIV